MNKRDVWVLFVILILILTIYLYPIIYEHQSSETVTIFVIDSFGEGVLSHGDVVSSIIEQEVPNFNIKRLNVKEESRYGINKYYEALDEVYRYKLNNTNEKVIVNISLGFYEAERYHEIMIRDLSKLGVGIIAAAGNDDSPISFYPAAFEDYVIAVASIEGKQKTDYSNYGKYIDICAEGNFFTTVTLPQMFSYRASGTSFAAPRVSAIISKIMASNESINFNQAVQRLYEITVPLEDQLYEDGFLGEGKISSFKYLLNYNMAKLIYYYTIPLIIFLLIFYLLVKRLGFLAIPYSFLIFIVIGPFFVIIRDHFFGSFNDRIFTLYNFKLTIIFVISYLLSKMVTGFEKYYLLKLYIALNIIISIILEYLGYLTLENFGIFNIVFILALFTFEWIQIKRKKDSNQISDLKTNSKKVIHVVENNIINNVDMSKKNNINNLLGIYITSRQPLVKKSVIDIIFKTLPKVPVAFLFENTRKYNVKIYLCEKINKNKERVKVKSLFKIINLDK
ncbi:MAG: S8 family peptidase, partial [Bacillota bacterium]